MLTANVLPAGSFNFWIGVDYTRVVPDRKNHRVVVDLIETIVSLTKILAASVAHTFSTFKF